MVANRFCYANIWPFKPILQYNQIVSSRLNEADLTYIPLTSHFSKHFDGKTAKQTEIANGVKCKENVWYKRGNMTMNIKKGATREVQKNQNQISHTHKSGKLSWLNIICSYVWPIISPSLRLLWLSSKAPWHKPYADQGKCDFKEWIIMQYLNTK